jgi:hypothetical protein
MAFCIEHGLEYHEAADFFQANFLVLCMLKLHVCGVDLCAIETTESVNTLMRVVLS